MGDGTNSITVVVAVLSTKLWLTLADDGTGVSDDVGVTEMVCDWPLLTWDRDGLAEMVGGKGVKLD